MAILVGYNNKWIANGSLVGACLCTTCGGIVYAFSLYGPQLAAEMGYSSVEVNTIAIAGNVGVYATSPLFGYLADNQKPSLVVKLSSFLFLFGFSGMMLTFGKVLPYEHFLIMAFYYFLVGTAGGCAYMNATSTTGHNFKKQRGFGIGLPVAFFGLSAFVFSFFNRIFFINGEEHDTYGFLKFMGLSTSITTFLGSFLLIKIEESLIYEESGLSRGDSSGEYGAIETSSISSSSTPNISNTVVEQTISGWDLVANRDAQMLFTVILVVAGSGLVYINNIGTLLHTLDVVSPVTNLPHLQSLSVSLLSLSSCSGRFIFATFSDYLSNLTRPIRRVDWLVLSTLVVGSIQLLTAYAPADNIALYSTILGFGYGVLFSVSPTMTSVWFGASKFGFNWGLLNVAPAIGGQLMSILFGTIYDLHLDSEDSQICKLGIECYQLTFQLLAGLCFSCTLIAYFLKRRREAHYI